MALLLAAAVSAASTSRLAEVGRRSVTVNGSTPSLSTLMPHGSDEHPTPPRMGSVHAHPNVVVISCGGTGTTTMMRELAAVEGLRLNNDDDREGAIYTDASGHKQRAPGMKHLPFGRLMQEYANHSQYNLRDTRRILYLWGDPLHAVASLYRRHFETVQVTKTRSHPFSDGTFSLAAAKAELPPTLEAYAMAEGEPFQMREHFESYLNAAASWAADGDAPKVAFLQMERKAEHLDRLAAFLGVEQSALEKVVSPWRDAEAAENHAERQLATAGLSLLAGEGAVAAAEDALGAIAMERLRDAASLRRRGGAAGAAAAAALLAMPPPSEAGTESHGTKASAAVIDAINAKFTALRLTTAALSGDGFFVVGEDIRANSKT